MRDFGLSLFRKELRLAFFLGAVRFYGSCRFSIRGCVVLAIGIEVADRVRRGLVFIGCFFFVRCYILFS